MLTLCLRWLPAAGLLFGIAPAQAQSPPEGAGSPPALHYRSAFDGYRRHDDQRVDPWQDVNDTVGRIGGWRTYAKESAPAGGAAPASTPSPAQAPAVPPTAPPSGTAAPAAPSGTVSGAHGGHGARP